MDRDPLAHARALAAAGRFTAALRHLAGLPAPPAGLDLLRLGIDALGRNDAFAAVAAFQDLMAVDPDFPGARDGLVSAYRRDARYGDAVALAESAPMGRQIAYERALALTALGDGAAALAGFDAILAADPDHAVSWFASHGPALERNGLDDGLDRLARACACPGANGRYWAFPVAYGLLTGRPVPAVEAARVAPFPPRRALVDGVRALLAQLVVTPPPRLFGVSASVLDFAVDQAGQPGLVLEFGVRRGTSLNRLAARAGQTVHGFDSFEGLPQSWGAEPAGRLTCGARLPAVAANARLHPGWFSDTLAPFLAAHAGPVRLVNIDSDIYQSAREVLFALAPRLVPGSVVVFDEMIGNRTWADDEFRAFAEYRQAFGVTARVLAVAPATKQVVTQILTSAAR